MDAQTQIDGSIDSKDVNIERLTDSMGTMLGCTESELKACSIFRVPTTFRKSNEEAYRPKVVSIGPLHRGTRNDLLYMEEIKWRCMLYLFSRTTRNTELSLIDCCKYIIKLDEVVRASYVGDIKFDRYDLAKIMILDGCFLLELLICCAFPSESDDSPGMGVQKYEEVLSDVKVLENQIPFFILDRLSTILLPDHFGKEPGQPKFAKFAAEFAPPLLGYGPGSSFISISSSAHFLELVHSFVTGKTERAEESQDCMLFSIINVQSENVGGRSQQSQKGKMGLERCATRLRAAGIKIKPHSKHKSSNDSMLHTLRKFWLMILKIFLKSSTDNKPVIGTPIKTQFDFNVKFLNRELIIPPLHVTKTTEVEWRNFIAWEQNRAEQDKFIATPAQRSKMSCKFSLYASFFQGLICCVHDIQLLRDSEVLIVHDEEMSEEEDKVKKKMSNEELVTLFGSIAEGAHHLHHMDSSFISKLFWNLNTYSGADRAKETRIITWHYIRRIVTSVGYICRNWSRILIRDHIPTVWKLIAVLAATALLGLTIAQTIFSARG